jgi:hypothetical protein
MRFEGQVAYLTDMRNIHKILIKKLNWKENLRDLASDGKIILK